MVKIKREGNDYKLNFSAEGQRFSVIAKDLSEIAMALAHYYRGDDAFYPIHWNGQFPDTCPICRKYGKKS